MDAAKLTPKEHQELVLMTGSKKAWQTYLGLDDKTARSKWIELQLQAPGAYARSCPADELTHRVLSLGHDKAAAQFGMSKSGLIAILRERGLATPVNKPAMSEEQLTDMLTTYGSVRFAARILDIPESWLRQEAARLDIDARLLIDYSIGNNANAKGRRAEQDFAKLRGSNITRDLNLTEGSQADYDFDDKLLGRVNVKSSRQYSYKASTRKDAPDFWKVSLNASEKCDRLVCMCYDEKGETLIGMKVIEGCHGITTKTLVILRNELDPPSKWTIV